MCLRCYNAWVHVVIFPAGALEEKKFSKEAISRMIGTTPDVLNRLILTQDDMMMAQSELPLDDFLFHGNGKDSYLYLFSFLFAAAL
jgi:hypothetical protein